MGRCLQRHGFSRRCTFCPVGRAARCARGRLPARSPSAPRASLGASARCPARPRRRPPAPRPCPLASSGPSGALQTSGAGSLTCGSARRLGARPGPAAAHRHRGLPARLLSMPRTLLDTSARSPARTRLSASMSHVIPLRVFQTLNSHRWNCNVLGHSLKLTALNYVRLMFGSGPAMPAGVGSDSLAPEFRKILVAVWRVPDEVERYR